MDGHRFDHLARRLAAATSRRQVLTSVAAGLGAVLLGASRGSAQDTGGNSACARFCKTVFAPGRARGQCTSNAAHGRGLCPACGADASRVCFAPDGVASCPDRSTDPLHCGGCNNACASGSCVAGACLKQNGDACGAGAECRSAFCADGVCCDGACAGQCEACDATGACVPVSGAPLGNRAACASDGSSCGGACDGTNRAACAHPDATAACADPVCRDGDAVTAACDGQGRCVERTTGCGLFVCHDGACLDACGDNDDCLGQAYCADGVCAADKGPGQPCAGRDECASGACVDGVCCDGACTGQCEACDVAGLVGTCSPVPAGAAPRGDRQACAGTGVCAGACNGVDRTACVFPAAGIECLPVACEGSTLTAVSMCDGAGTCVPGQTTDCSPYVCGDGACTTTCDDPGDCADGHCIANACCPGEDFCPTNAGDVCCSPDRAPTETCCPATGGCCECFHRTDPGNNRIECCPPDMLCKSLTNSPAGDHCLHIDEVCVNGLPCWEGRACAGSCCPTTCCNGECCAFGEECAVAPGDTVASCQPVRACTVDSECTTAAGELCASQNGVCCPPARTISFEVETDEGPLTVRICCPWGQKQHHAGEPFCCNEPDRCGTSRGSFSRP